MKKYNIIYADPPWYYPGGGFPSSSDKQAYPLMKTADICALPVRGIAQPDALLFLWTTMTHIPDALRVIEAWGFRYVTNGFTWIKVHEKSRLPVIGMGYWTRQNAELCLVAKRGRHSCSFASGKTYHQHKAVSSRLIEPRRRYSQKPDRVRHDIVRISRQSSARRVENAQIK